MPTLTERNVTSHVPRDSHPWRGQQPQQKPQAPQYKVAKVCVAVTTAEMLAIRRLKRPSQSVSEFLRDSLPPQFWAMVHAAAQN